METVNYGRYKFYDTGLSTLTNEVYVGHFNRKKLTNIVFFAWGLLHLYLKRTFGFKVNETSRVIKHVNLRY